MTHVLVDTSVVIKWFHSAGEREIAEARSICAAHLRGEVDAHILDLGLYELGNVLIRALQWPAEVVTQQLDDVRLILGQPLTLPGSGFGRAARLAAEHGLSYYDAAWAACADELGIPLVTADRRLFETGLAETATAFVERLRLTP